MSLINAITVDGLNVRAEGETVKFKYVGNESDDQHVAIQAIASWKYEPSDSTIYYYEVHVKECKDAVCIGLAVAPFPTTGKMPGWLQGSYAYHGDDGNRFAGGSGKRGWPTYQGGDIAGLGLKSSTGEIFGTLNGKYLGVIESISDEQKEIPHYPTIGVNAAAELDVVFGKKDFKFDISSLPESLVPIFGSLETDMEGNKLLVLFLNEVDETEAAKMKGALQQVAPDAKAKCGYQSLFTLGGTRLASGLQDFVGITRSPLLIAVNLESKNEKYALPEGQPITLDTLHAFLESIASGKAQAILKSAPRPPNDRNPDHPSIVQVVRDSFEEIVLGGSKDILLDVYADWCGPCVSIAPTIALLADTLADNETIAIAKLDCDANDVDRAYIPETSIPNIKLFTAANKAQPVKYQGDRSLDNFLEFLHANSTVKFDLKVAKAKGQLLTLEYEKKQLKNVKHVATTEAFKEYLTSADKLVLVDFYATWCPPCKVIAPIYADLSEKYPGVLFLKVNVDQQRDVAREQDITCMPTIKAYMKGLEIGKLEGASPSQLEALITENL